MKDSVCRDRADKGGFSVTRAERQAMWAGRVASFRSSGQSMAAWCAANGINPRQLRYWLKKEAQPSDMSARWPPLDLSEMPTRLLSVRIGQAAIEVKPGFDPELLLNVVRTLGRL